MELIMGYNTSYSLSIQADYEHELDEERFYGALLERSKCSDGNFDNEFLELVEEGCAYGHLYDIEEYIDELAPKFPHLLIILSGDGDDNDDKWEARWKGKDKEIQRAIIPPFENPNLQTKYEKSNH